jgi:hypothetical protein
MAEDWKDRRARRVVVGTDRAGRAVIESDEITPTQMSSSGFNISDVWVVQTLPANIRDGAPTDMADTIPREGILIRAVTFQPDGEGDVDPASDRGAVEREDLKTTARDSGIEIAGLHRTDSVDVGTVISGELTLLLPTGGITLRPGETFVLRGNEHAWRNRTPQPVTIVVTMIGAR